MAHRKVETTYHIRRVVEYCDFFKGEAPVEIGTTLKHINRNTLIRMVTILTHHYGNMSLPNDQYKLFSESSKKHFSYLNKLFRDYYKREKIERGQKVEMLTYRTSLELWRWIFSIHAEEFRNDVEETDIELLLFKVILAINEKIVSFKEREKHYQLDELLFLNGFLTNDSNHYDMRAVMQPQMYYFIQLVEFIPTNEVLTNATEKLFNDWGIERWQQYFYDYSVYRL